MLSGQLTKREAQVERLLYEKPHEMNGLPTVKFESYVDDRPWVVNGPAALGGITDIADRPLLDLDFSSKLGCF